METHGTILAVDDESNNLEIYQEIFDDDNFVVKTAQSGEQGLELLEEYNPEIVLLDIMMPGMDGYEVCKRIKKNQQAKLTKTIMVSGKAMIAERMKGYDVGADDYITKPFVAEELEAKVNSFFRLAKMEKELSQINASLEAEVKTRTIQLLKSERVVALGQMASGLGHEIRNPLGAVVGYSGLLEHSIEKLKDHEQSYQKLLKYAKQIQRGAGQIEQIADNLKIYSRDGSQDPFLSQQVDYMVQGVVDLSQNRMKKSNIRLEVEGLPSYLSIDCRMSQICQVLINLLNNARDAVKNLKDPWIQVSITPLNKEEIEISVTDSGPGIDKEVQAKMFDTFFTTKATGEGIGLGLSFSKNVVLDHQGKIFVDNDCEHTRLVIQLPQKRQA